MFASQAALVIANARTHRNERRAKSDLETFVITAPVGVLVFDARSSKLTSINREARRIAANLHPPDGSAEQLLAVVTFRRADGRSVTILVNATSIRSDHGDIVSVVITLQELTPLEELDRLRAEFLAMVSHELRAPLTYIKGSATTLLDAAADLDPAEMRQFHRIVDDHADYMRDLLDVARIATGTLSLTPQPTNVVDLVDDARNRFLSGGASNILHIDFPRTCPGPGRPAPRHPGPRQPPVQRLQTLPLHSTIRISVACEVVHVTLSVSEKGRGIPAERIQLLFRKFPRIDGDNGLRDLARSSLGLAICKGIVEAHGDRIWAESDGPGLGARFTFSLPLTEPTDIGRSRRPTKTQRVRILAVDDNSHALRYIRAAFSKAGYSPTVTGDPDEALHFMQANRPHLVLLDLLLPDTDGIQLMQKLRDFADIPAIFLSAYGHDEVVARAFDMGAADYIVKPFPLPSSPPGSGRPPQTRVPQARRSLRALLSRRPHHRLFATPRRTRRPRVDLQASPLPRLGGRNSGDVRPIRTAVKDLRRKLRDDASNPSFIFAEPRVGYRMAGD